MVQSAKVRQHDLQSKITKIRGQLAAMRDYKRLIAIDGLEPDAEDKVRESELIVRLLYLEKQLNGPNKPQTKSVGRQMTPGSASPRNKFSRRGAR